jgi:pancreatic elastase II
MKVFILFGLIAHALATDQYVVGGTDTTIEAYPWQGGWISGTSFSCGCVVVHQSWVLTAAHCVGQAPTNYQVDVGSTTREQGTRSTPTTVTRHPEYNTGTGAYPNDVAVVAVAIVINGQTVVAVPGGIDTGIDRVAHQCFISGWGRTCGTCALPTTLQHTQIPVIDDATCTQRWGANYNPSVHVCVWGGMGAGIGACSGDSGGPLVCRSDAADSYDLVGVTSWGSSGCNTDFPSVYTRLSTFRSFICSETGGAVAC